MPASVPVFRIFVSSTFSDLGDERRAIDRRVFPQLRELCERRGAQFQAIDLRWGVTFEAASDQRTVAICLGEVDRCLQATPQPNFLLLLGGRYGWRPPPASVRAHVFERLRARMTADARQLVDLWYVEDQNAVPPAYVLQSRRGTFADQARWQPVERALQRAFGDAARLVGLPADERRPFEASVTELEIRRALDRTERASSAAMAFLRTIPQLPPGAATEAFFDVVDGRLDRPAAEAAARLTAYVRAKMRGHVHDYVARWEPGSARLSPDHLDTLCVEVRSRLDAAIRAQLDAVETQPEWRREVRDHEEFGAQRCANFVGRQDVLGAVDTALAAATAPVLLTGAPGSGKTELLAEVAARRRRTGGGDERSVIVRFIGVTPRSSQVRTLLHDLTTVLRDQRRAGEGAAPSGTDAAVRAFREELEQPRPGRAVLLVIDAFDQLAGDVVDLAWLPTELSRGVQMLISAQTGPMADALTHYLGTRPVTVPPMPVEDGAQLLDAWLQGAGRTLRTHQCAETLRAFGALGLPLHLRLAFEEARRWSGSSPVPPGSLADDVPGLIDQLIDRLRDEHGDALPAAALGYLAASRNGLSESEQLDLLSRDGAVGRKIAVRFPLSPATGVGCRPCCGPGCCPIWSRISASARPTAGSCWGSSTGSCSTAFGRGT